MKSQSMRPLAAAICTSFLACTIAPTVSAAGNPFASNLLEGGYHIAAAEKPAEGKCGEGQCGGDKKSSEEGKCGEGKCGGDKKASHEGKCGDDQKTAQEGKCGEGKCGGDKKATQEGKCGEGKCGGAG